MRAILFDLDGVLYQGEHALAGAAEAVRWVQQGGIPHLFLTNTTSRPRAALVDKLAGFGVHTDAEHLLTPPVAAARWLAEHAAGPLALFVPEATRADFAAFAQLAPDHEGAAAVVLGDLGEAWDFATLNRAFRLLMAPSRPPLVALGLTRYWQAGERLLLDVGPFVKGLEYAAGVEAVVTGKPAAAFYRAALDILGVAAVDTLMIGDDIRGDIEGAQAAGLKAWLVRTGKFRPEDLELGVRPDAVLESVAELPGRWQAMGGE